MVQSILNFSLRSMSLVVFSLVAHAILRSTLDSLLEKLDID